MKLRSFVIVLLVSIILISCAPSTQVIPTNTAIPTSTFTPIPPTPTVVTPTPDPLANAPKGFTNFDKTLGVWTRIDEESGKTVFWDAEKQTEYSLLFDDFLLDYGPDIEGSIMLDGKTRLSDQLEFKVYIDPSIQNWNKLTLTHKENADPSNKVNWTSYFGTNLVERMIYKDLVSSQLDFNLNKWYTKGYSISYKTKEGAQTLFLGNGNVTTVHIRGDYEALKANQDNNNFTDTVGGDLRGDSNIKYMVKISSDKDGNTFVEIAPNITDALKWSDKRIIEMILFGFSDALCIPDEILIPRPTPFSSEVAVNHVSFPYFTFTRTK